MLKAVEIEPDVPGETIICVVAAQAARRRALCQQLGALGVRLNDYAGSRLLLEDHDALRRAGCLVLDLDLAGLDGLHAQERLIALGSELPLIFLSGPLAVPLAVRAMKNGALDILLHPVDPVALLDLTRRALALDGQRRALRAGMQRVRARLGRLTPREREVLECVLEGGQNKRIAVQLGISTKTVEQHRARIMEKMHADSLAVLVRQVTELRVLEACAGA